MNDKKTIFLNIKKIMLEKKISQAKLAEGIGYSRNGLNIAFKNFDIKLSTLDDIAKFLGVSMHSFFGIVENIDTAMEPNANYRAESDTKEKLIKKIRCLKEQIELKDKLISSLENQVHLLQNNLNKQRP